MEMSSFFLNLGHTFQFFFCIITRQRDGRRLCSFRSFRGHPLLQRQREQPTGAGAVRRAHLQRSGELHQPVDRRVPRASGVHVPADSGPLSHAAACVLQDSPRPASATACSAAWRSSGLSAAPATGTAATTATRCAGQTASSTRTCARWRSSPVGTGRASSRSRRPSAHRVRALLSGRSSSSRHQGQVGRNQFTSWRSGLSVQRRRRLHMKFTSTSVNYVCMKNRFNCTLSNLQVLYIIIIILILLL